MIKRLVTAVPVVVLLSLLVHVPAASASITFTPGSPTVTSRTSLVSGSCRGIPIALPYTASGGLLDGFASVQVTQGTKTVGHALMLLDLLTKKLRDTFWYCPGVDPLGTFKAGPTSGSYCESLLECHAFTSTRTTTFSVKQGSRFAAPKSSRSGSTVTVGGTLQYFKVAGLQDAWTPRASGTKVALQRRASSGSGAWTTVRTAGVNAKGVVTFVEKTTKTYQYRLSVVEGSTTWDAVSSTMKR